MSWRSSSLLQTLGLTIAALLFAAGPAAAQRGGHGGGGHGGGASHGGGGSRGASAAHAGSFHSGGNMPHGGTFHSGSVSAGHYNGYYHRGSSYYPGLYGFGLGLGYAASYGYGNSYYPPSYYDVGSLGYYDVAPSYYATLETPIPYRSYYPPMPANAIPPDPNAAAPADTKAHVRVIVPADAEIWFDGDKTSQTGTAREFVSPPLTLDTDYAYEIRARWMENGKPVEQTRSVTVRGGSLTMVNFTRPSPNK
jgi:uncharacterized protein (TIGR03000 family)